MNNSYANKTESLGPSPKHIVQNVLPSQTNIDESGFNMIGERKQVVVNERAEEANWVRKRNAMSKNEIKRQSDLLRNLPMIPSI